jgi:hypothetical protein
VQHPCRSGSRQSAARSSSNRSRCPHESRGARSGQTVHRVPVGWKCQ